MKRSGKRYWNWLYGTIENVLGKVVKVDVREILYDGGRFTKRGISEMATWVMREYRKAQLKDLRAGYDPPDDIEMPDAVLYVKSLVSTYTRR